MQLNTGLLAGVRLQSNRLKWESEKWGHFGRFYCTYVVLHIRVRGFTVFFFPPFSSSAPFTKYRIVLRAFTKKREGPASDALVVTTDTVAPAAPIITNLTCHGSDGVQVLPYLVEGGGS